LRELARDRNIRRAYQSVRFAVGDHENDPPVVVLQDERVLALVQPGQHDVAALDQPDFVARRLRQLPVQHRLHPGARGIDDSACRYGLAAGELRQPQIILSFRRQALGTREDANAARTRVHRIRNHQTRVIHPAVGIDESVPELRLQPRVVGRGVQPDRVRPRQAGAA